MHTQIFDEECECTIWCLGWACLFCHAWHQSQNVLRGRNPGGLWCLSLHWTRSEQPHLCKDFWNVPWFHFAIGDWLNTVAINTVRIVWIGPPTKIVPSASNTEWGFIYFQIQTKIDWLRNIIWQLQGFVKGEEFCFRFCDSQPNVMVRVFLTKNQY